MGKRTIRLVTDKKGGDRVVVDYRGDRAYFPPVKNNEGFSCRWEDLLQPTPRRLRPCGHLANGTKQVHPWPLWFDLTGASGVPYQIDKSGGTGWIVPDQVLPQFYVFEKNYTNRMVSALRLDLAMGSIGTRPYSPGSAGVTADELSEAVASTIAGRLYVLGIGRGGRLLRYSAAGFGSVSAMTGPAIASAPAPTPATATAPARALPAVVAEGQARVGAWPDPGRQVTYVCGTPLHRVDSSWKHVNIAVDENTGAIRKLPPTIDHCLGIDPKGRWLFAPRERSSSTNLMRYRLPAGDAADQCQPIIGWGVRLVFSPDAKEVSLLRTDEANRVRSYRLDDIRETRATFDCQGGCGDLVYHPTADLVVASVAGRIQAFNRAGQMIQDAVDLGGAKLKNVQRLYFAPSGRYLLIDHIIKGQRMLQAFRVKAPAAGQEPATP